MYQKRKWKTGASVGLDMTAGKILPIMIQYAIPLLLTNLIQQLYNVADMIIVGNVVGTAGTVGVSSGGILPTFLIGIGNAFGGAAQICTAQLWGARKREKVAGLANTTLCATLTGSAVAAGLCMLFAETFLKLLNCPQEAYHQAVSYLRIVILGLPFILGYNVISGVMRGIGESRRPLLFVTISAISNVVLDIVFVMFFSMETAGSAWATVIAQVLVFVASMVYACSPQMKGVFSFHKGWFRIQSQYMYPVLKIALPQSLQFGCIHFSQIICTSWVNSFGMLAATTTSIGNKIIQFVGVVTLSINNAAGAMVAQNLGAKRFDRVKRTVYAAIMLGSFICAAEFAVALMVPEQLFSLFTRDAQVIVFGRTFLKITLITFFLNTLQGPYTSVITGSGNTKLSFAYGALDGLVLRLGIAYVLSFICQLGVVGYWYGNALAHLAPVIIGVVYFYSGRWMERRLVSDELKGE